MVLQIDAMPFVLFDSPAQLSLSCLSFDFMCLLRIMKAYEALDILFSFFAYCCSLSSSSLFSDLVRRVDSSCNF